MRTSVAAALLLLLLLHVTVAAESAAHHRRPVFKAYHGIAGLQTPNEIGTVWVLCTTMCELFFILRQLVGVFI
jgi:hypothetical protein